MPCLGGAPPTPYPHDHALGSPDVATTMRCCSVASDVYAYQIRSALSLQGCVLERVETEGIIGVAELG
jgi:hypothetical protein